MKKAHLVTRWSALLSVGATVSALLALTLSNPAMAADDTLVTPNIVGGTQATIADAPWQVALVDPTAVNEYQGQFCGGSIIAAQWVVTAAHCVVDGGGMVAASTIRVLAGQATLSESGNTRPVVVSNIYVHPLYVASRNHDDVALLKLATPLTLTAGSVQAIGLPSAAPIVGSTDLITGWGDIASGSGQYPSVMRKAQVSVFDDSTCSSVYGRSYKSALMVCAANNAFTIDTCQGDSGGPLANFNGTAWVLDGITSFGQGCAQAPYPGVYTEVNTYVSWINGYVSPPLSAFTTAPTPTIGGSAVAGQTLTARTGTWVPTPDSFAYQWSVGGSPVAGAAGSASTYLVSSADAGSTITVTVTAKKAGYADTPKTSSASAAVTLPFVTAPVPTIGGTKLVGRTLTAREGAWSPTPTSYTYRWLSSATRTGVYTPISGATLRTYVLKSTDRTRFIKVEVTAVKAGYVSTKMTSAATVAIG